jgi:methyl-accepting chemotaxis protein
MTSVEHMKKGVNDMITDGNNINTCMSEVSEIADKISSLVEKTNMLNESAD